MRLLLTVAVLATCSKSASKERAASEAITWISLASPERGDLQVKSAIEKLEAARKTADAGDAELINKSLAVIHELEQAGDGNNPHLVSALRQYLELLHTGALLYPDDVAMQRTVVATLAVMAENIRSLGVANDIDPDPVLADALTRARSLVEKFKTDARSWKLLGFVLVQSDDELGAIRAYEHCTQLDGAPAECATRLRELRAAYTSPYCEGPDIRRTFAWHEGHDASFDGSVATDDPQVFISTASKWNADYLARVQQGTAMGEPIVRLRWRPPARRGFASWLDDVQSRHGFAVLMSDSTVLFTTKNSFLVATPRNEWTITKLSLDTFCTKTTTASLP